MAQGTARDEPGPLLRTEDGVELTTRLWYARDPAPAAVVLVHGLSANKDHPRVVALAEDLRRQGLDVVAYDSRGHGRSGGYCTLGDLERHDVAAAVAWARSRHQDVVAVGASMGAVAVLSYAAGAEDVTGVVAVSSPAEWRLPLHVRSLLTAGLARTRPGRWVADRRMQVRIAPWSSPEPPRSIVERVTCPLVIIHGGRDAIIPPGNGLPAVLMTDERRQVVHVPHMGHAFDPAGYQAIDDAVAWVLGQARRGAPAS